MPPLFAQPTMLQPSVTRTTSAVTLSGRRFVPHRERYVPTPASRSRRFVAGDDHVACCTRWKRCEYPPASGDVVFGLPNTDSNTWPLDGLRQPSPCGVHVAPLQGCCSSQKMFTLLRELICVVRRPLRICQLFGLRAGVLVSNWTFHGAAAFEMGVVMPSHGWLAKTQGIVCQDPSSR